MDETSESGVLNCSLISNCNELTLNSSCNKCLRQKRKKDTYNPLPSTMQQNLERGFSNGRWTLEEHTQFIKGILKYGNKWKKIQALIETRNCLQARSHAQKFFSKLEHMGIVPVEICNLKAIYNHCLSLNQEELSKVIYLLTIVAFEKLDKDCLKKDCFISKDIKDCCSSLSNKSSIIKIPILTSNEELSLSKY